MSHVQTHEDVRASARERLDLLKAEQDTSTPPEAAPATTPPVEPAEPEAGDGGKGGGRHESQATALVRLVSESGAELWHLANGDPYISVPVGGAKYFISFANSTVASASSKVSEGNPTMKKAQTMNRSEALQSISLARSIFKFLPMTLGM